MGIVTRTGGMISIYDIQNNDVYQLLNNKHIYIIQEIELAYCWKQNFEK